MTEIGKWNFSVISYICIYVYSICFLWDWIVIPFQWIHSLYFKLDKTRGNRNESQNIWYTYAVFRSSANPVHLRHPILTIPLIAGTMGPTDALPSSRIMNDIAQRRDHHYLGKLIWFIIFCRSVDNIDHGCSVSGGILLHVIGWNMPYSPVKFIKLKLKLFLAKHVTLFIAVTITHICITARRVDILFNNILSSIN